jgi:hypothetical protein
MQEPAVFTHRPHPRLEQRKQVKPPQTADEHLGFNGRIALVLTTGVGTMWCAYLFAILALLVVPQAIQGGLLTFVQWVSQTFIQLVMLSVIMVGQNILGRVSDKRAIMTYEDAEAVLHEAQQIQAHLTAQDERLVHTVEAIERAATVLDRLVVHLGIVAGAPARQTDGSPDTGR